jgi:hypothetical protein
LALRIKNGQMKEAVEYSVNILPARMWLLCVVMVKQV